MANDQTQPATYFFYSPYAVRYESNGWIVGSVVRYDTGLPATTIQLQLSSISTTAADFDWRRSDAPPVEFLANGDALIRFSFSAGAGYLQYAIPLADDTLAEPDEQFTLRLQVPAEQLRGEAVQQLTILDDDPVAIYRFCDTRTGQYLYTASEQEKQSILAHYPGWRDEGVAFWAYGQPTANMVEVHRYVQPATGARRLAADPHGPQAPGHADTWIDEGVAFWAQANTGRASDVRFSDAQPVFQLASPAAGTQLLTRSADEQRAALAQGHWNDEDVAFYVRSQPTTNDSAADTLADHAATTAWLPVNGRFSSRLNGTDDVDWLRVTLTAGKAYTLATYGGWTPPALLGSATGAVGYPSQPVIQGIYSATGDELPAETLYSRSSSNSYDTDLSIQPLVSGDYFIAIESDQYVLPQNEPSPRLAADYSVSLQDGGAYRLRSENELLGTIAYYGGPEDSGEFPFWVERSSDQTQAEFVQIKLHHLTTHPDDFDWNSDRAPAVTRLANGDMIIAVAFAEHQTVARFSLPFAKDSVPERDESFSLRLLLPADKHDIDGELSRKIVNDDMAIAYRFFNPVNGQYLYAADSQEIHDLQARLPQLQQQSVVLSAFTEPLPIKWVGVESTPPARVAVHRYVNQHTGAVLLSADATEQASIASQYPAWHDQGILGYLDPHSTYSRDLPVFRLANLVNGSYLFTQSSTDRSVALASAGWRDEGIAFYLPQPAPVSPSAVDGMPAGEQASALISPMPIDSGWF